MIHSFIFAFQFCDMIERVLVPEVLIKIYMDITGSDRETADEFLTKK